MRRPRIAVMLAVSSLLVLPVACSDGGLSTCGALDRLNSIEAERAELVTAPDEDRQDAEGQRLEALDVLDQAAGRDPGALGSLGRLRGAWVGGDGAGAAEINAALTEVNTFFSDTCS